MTDNYSKLKKSLPFSHMHIRHFFKQVRDIGKEKFTIEELKHQLKQYSWKENHWKADSDMLLFLQSLPDSRDNYLTRQNLECLALLWCKGTHRDKASHLYETLNPPSYDFRNSQTERPYHYSHIAEMSTEKQNNNKEPQTGT